ncbi:MAG: ABC transporter permease [Defluviitaleaceae bacterium]|nr:ABC transporter permease [Defluviitaleaceae bacterium]
MLTFTIRNLKIFFRDRAAVLFSLLAIFIAIAIYAFFTRNLMAANNTGFDGISDLADLWAMSGIISIMPVTTTIGAFAIMIHDRHNKIFKDFYTSPISRASLTGGYIASAIVIGFALTTFGLVITAIIIAALGIGLPLISFLMAIGVILLTIFAAAAIMFFVASLINSQRAFSSVATLIGTFVGFLAGVYMPVGMFPETVRTIIAIFPISHAASLLRQIFMNDAISHIFEGAPTHIIEGYRLDMGVIYEIGGTQTNAAVSVAVLAATAVVFFVLSMMNISRKRT